MSRTLEHFSQLQTIKIIVDPALMVGGANISKDNVEIGQVLLLDINKGVNLI